jgi:hypothetical protein
MSLAPGDDDDDVKAVDVELVLGECSSGTDVLTPAITVADEYTVVVGNSTWLERNDVTVDTSTRQQLADEQVDGKIAVLCAVNGRAVGRR